MQKFEYLQLACVRNYPERWFYYEGSTELGPQKNRISFLNLYGALGWELVSTNIELNNNHHQANILFYLKRLL